MTSVYTKQQWAAIKFSKKEFKMNYSALSIQTQDKSISIVTLGHHY